MGGKTSAKSKNTWISKAYDRINLTVAKGKKDTIQSHAEAQGESVNGFINRAIDGQMAQDARRSPSEALQGPPGVEMVYLPSQTVKAAQEAAEAAGEDMPVFVTRAVETQAQRDEMGRRMKGGKTSE